MQVIGQLYAMIALSLGKVLTVPQWIGKSLEWSKRRYKVCGVYKKKYASTGNPNPIFILFSLSPLTILIELLRLCYTYDTAQ